MQLDPGDVVIAYTDGVIEAANQSGEEWGVQGLLTATTAWGRQGTENAEHLVRSIFNSMDDFSKVCQADEPTLAVLRAGALTVSLSRVTDNSEKKPPAATIASPRILTCKHFQFRPAHSARRNHEVSNDHVFAS